MWVTWSDSLYNMVMFKHCFFIYIHSSFFFSNVTATSSVATISSIQLTESAMEYNVCCCTNHFSLALAAPRVHLAAPNHILLNCAFRHSAILTIIIHFSSTALLLTQTLHFSWSLIMRADMEYVLVVIWHFFPCRFAFLKHPFWVLAEVQITFNDLHHMPSFTQRCHKPRVDCQCRKWPIIYTFAWRYMQSNFAKSFSGHKETSFSRCFSPQCMNCVQVAMGVTLA